MDVEALHAAAELLAASSVLSEVVDMNDALWEEVVDVEPGEGLQELQAG